MTPRPRVPGRTAAALAACLGLGACSGYSPDEAFASVEAQATSSSTGVAAPSDAQEVTVLRVEDGDTVVVTGGAGSVLPGQGEHRVRLLLVDTPAVGGAEAEQECLGPEAAAFTSDLLPVGSTLALAADEDPVDDAGRLLAYAWTPAGEFVNEAVVANGLAYTALLPPNDEHIDVVLAAERRARTARLGIWGSC